MLGTRLVDFVSVIQHTNRKTLLLLLILSVGTKTTNLLPAQKWDVESLRVCKMLVCAEFQKEYNILIPFIHVYIYISGTHPSGYCISISLAIHSDDAK